MKISQLVFNLDDKPVKKAIDRIEYLYKKVSEYNRLVTDTNIEIEKYLKLRKKANIKDKNEKNKKD